MSQVATLRRTLEARFPGAVPVAFRTARAVSLGVAQVDAALPGGGLPRGQLSAWSGVGATALLRSACAAALGRGERAAWIDAAATTWPDAGWAGVTLARPVGRREAWLCAEELLRSGGFGVVVLSGAGTAGAERVRLARAAREGGAAYVEAAEGAEGFMAGLRLASWCPPGEVRWKLDALGQPVEVESVGVRVRATALGWSREAEVRLPVAVRDVRLSLEPGLGDRRGTAR